MITLSETAAREIKTIAQREELDLGKVRLRVGVKGGGCSGFSYLLDLTETQKETDEAFEQHGITIVCDPKSLLYLGGDDDRLPRRAGGARICVSEPERDHNMRMRVKLRCVSLAGVVGGEPRSRLAYSGR